jgi:hypothetical protein
MTKRRLTIAQAQAEGFIVDTTCYPHVGYKGPRFRPTYTVDVLTELEAGLINALGSLLTDVENGVSLGYAFDDPYNPFYSSVMLARALLGQYRADDLLLHQTPDGWTFHPPASKHLEDALIIHEGSGEPTEEDQAEAFRKWAGIRG